MLRYEYIALADVEISGIIIRHSIVHTDIHRSTAGAVTLAAAYTHTGLMRQYIEIWVLIY